MRLIKIASTERKKGRLGLRLGIYSNPNSYAETLKEAIMKEAANLYEKMLEEFTNETITNTAADSRTERLPSMTHLGEHTNHKQTLLTYRRSKVKFQFKI